MKASYLAFSVFFSLSSLTAFAESKPFFLEKQAAEYIQIDMPTLTLTHPDAKEGVFLCDFTNQGTTPHTLIAAFSPYAKSTRLDQHSPHSHSFYLDSLTLAPQSHYHLESKGTLIRMSHLKNPLKKGDEVPVTLFFSDGSHKDLMVKTFVNEEKAEG